MSIEKEGFRERFAEVGSGFKVEKPKAHSMPVLKTDTNIDLSKLEKFADSRAEMKGVSEKIKPEGMSGIQLDTNLDKLNEGLEKVRRAQINDKIRGLVEGAERLIDLGKYSPAVMVLDKALVIDPNSFQTLYLKGFCLYNLESYVPALDVLEDARRNTNDSESIFLTMVLQTTCQRAITDQLEKIIFELMDSKRYAQALEFIERELRRDPTHAALLYYRCLVLMELKRYSEAKRQANEAMNVVYEENTSLFEELLDRILFREYEKPVHAAREALRRGDAAQAVKELQTCQAGLAGKESFEAMWAYAEDKKGSGGFFQSLFARKKAKPMTEDERQIALSWLLSEEIETGIALMNIRDYESAILYYEDAAKIDSNCTLVSLFHGAAIFNGFRDAVDRQEDIGNIDDAIKKLEKGASLLRHASSDKVTAEQSELFLKLINNDIEELKDLKQKIDRQIAEMKPVNETIQEYNALMDKIDKSLFDTANEIDWFEKQFHNLEQKVAKIIKTCSKENREYLTQFKVAIGANLKELTQIRGELPITDLIKEFKALMDRLNQGSIGSISDIDSFESQFSIIKKKAEKLLKGISNNKVKDVVKQIITAVNDNLSELNKLRSASILMVNECVKEFSSFMDGLERNRIGTRAQLSAARSRVIALNSKLDKARTAILAENKVSNKYDAINNFGFSSSLPPDLRKLTLGSSRRPFDDSRIPANVRNSDSWKVLKDVETTLLILEKQLSQINEWQLPY